MNLFARSFLGDVSIRISRSWLTRCAIVKVLCASPLLFRVSLTCPALRKRLRDLPTSKRILHLANKPKKVRTTDFHRLQYFTEGDFSFVIYFF